MTQEQYENEFVSRYMRWCLQFGITEEHLQQLLANSAVNMYYIERHDDLEAQAYAILLPQDAKIPIDAARRIYDAILRDIFKTYPKPLIDAARKANVIGNPNLN